MPPKKKIDEEDNIAKSLGDLTIDTDLVNITTKRKQPDSFSSISSRSLSRSNTPASFDSLNSVISSDSANTNKALIKTKRFKKTNQLLEYAPIFNIGTSTKKAKKTKKKKGGKKRRMTTKKKN